VTQLEMAQIIPKSGVGSVVRRTASPFRQQPTGFFVSKIGGDQVVRTPASANINLRSRGAYQVTVGIERVQKTRLIAAGIWLNAPQCVFVYEEGRLHRAVVSPKPHSMPRAVV
jgi:hypothetical protein